ncbi:hypothetical protein KUTeg_003127 [Tegillarca granosa]|uniref:GH18 domain-containing protein n=1 Tax=Tegillarca granosa TaxID=220873 RepID=A0ABQ9FL81_TEGGR|nr:hypothetical protein KUTeg_003127 [Tegillarca granosa]
MSGCLYMAIPSPSKTQVHTGINDPIRAAGQAGQFTNQAGILAYYEICKMIKNGATRHWIDGAEVPYLVQRDQWVGYDDPESLRKKVDFVKQNGFGGIMVWALTLDDFSGTCGDGNFPLMHAINDELNKAGPVAVNGIGKFKPENIDPNLCTHLNYAFATLNGNKLKAFEWNDESTPWMKGMYEKFNDLKKQNPSLKTLLAVGGWNLASGPFHRMVATDSSRREFATTSIEFLRKNGFDGLDLDWEYPTLRGGAADDKHKFTQLCQVLREEFEKEAQRTGKPRLLLSAAVAAGKDKIDVAYEIPEISKNLDWINLMTYDLHGSWEDHTGEDAPLHGMPGETGNDTFLNVEYAANYWAKNGAPKDKINVGMPLYGHTFTLKDASHSDINDPIRAADL